MEPVVGWNDVVNATGGPVFDLGGPMADAGAVNGCGGTEVLRAPTGLTKGAAEAAGTTVLVRRGAPVVAAPAGAGVGRWAWTSEVPVPAEEVLAATALAAGRVAGTTGIGSGAVAARGRVAGEAKTTGCAVGSRASLRGAGLQTLVVADVNVLIAFNMLDMRWCEAASDAVASAARAPENRAVSPGPGNDNR